MGRGEVIYITLLFSKMGDICICMFFSEFMGVWYVQAFFGDTIFCNLGEPFLALWYSATSLFM